MVAPSFTVTTVVSKGKVDVNFRCMERDIGLNVDSKIKEKDIQRQVANSLQLNLNGYWVATVIEGLGRIGELVSGSTVELTPAPTAQIQRVVQARTTATADPKLPEASKGRRDARLKYQEQRQLERSRNASADA
jgi:hypothetical protein